MARAMALEGGLAALAAELLVVGALVPRPTPAAGAYLLEEVGVSGQNLGRTVFTHARCTRYSLRS